MIFFLDYEILFKIGVIIKIYIQNLLIKSIKL